VRANLIPSAEPCDDGFTTIGNSSRSSIAGSASAAPSSRNAVSLKAKKSGVGIPASWSRCLVSTLSFARTHASTPEPV
jgi:hypothetical protein